MVLEGYERALLEGVAARADVLVGRATVWAGINSGSRHLEGLERQRAVLEEAFSVLPGRGRGVAAGALR
jgi:glutamate carboxypeptidase